MIRVVVDKREKEREEKEMLRKRATMPTLKSSCLKFSSLNSLNFLHKFHHTRSQVPLTPWYTRSQIIDQKIIRSQVALAPDHIIIIYEQDPSILNIK